MNRPVFEFREHCGKGNVTAQDVGETLVAIQERDGDISAGAVVNEARPEESPIHPAFEWDDEVAAEKYREEEARRLIRSVVIVEPEECEEDDQDETVSVRMIDAPKAPAFVSVGNSSGGSRYLPTREAMADEDFRRKILLNAISGLMAWKARYAGLKAVSDELARVIDAIDELTNVPA